MVEANWVSKNNVKPRGVGQASLSSHLQEKLIKLNV